MERRPVLWVESTVKMETVSVHLVLSGNEAEFLREPAPCAPEKQKKAIILPCKVLLGLDPEALKIDVRALIDTGCEILAVVGPEVFPKHLWEDAPTPFRLIGAGSKELEGGRQGVRVTLLVPVAHQGTVIARCVEVFVHIASIGPRMILGLPFMARYGLAILPDPGVVVFQETLSHNTAIRPTVQPQPIEAPEPNTLSVMLIPCLYPASMYSCCTVSK